MHTNIKKCFLIFITICTFLSFCGCTERTDNVGINIQEEEKFSTDSLFESTAETGKTQINEQNLSDADNLLVVHYIDVGQGDSIFIELPDGETMLIDAGNQGNEDIISREIRNREYSKLNYVVATHPHNDHIGSMAEIIHSFDIGKIYMPKKSHSTKSFENLVNTIADNGMNIYTAKAGLNIIDNGSLKADILAPIGENYSDLNEYSAVIKIEYGQTSFLFMGDAGSIVENELMNSNADLSADVLKVGHHGSRYSTSAEFVKEVSPEYAVISCGTGNSYGLPHTQTLSVLADNKVDVYRTDEAGTVIITSDGINITIDKKASTIKENAPPSGASAATASTEEKITESIPELIEIDDSVVYITNTGKCYHRGECSSLSKSKIESTLSQAKAKGLTACRHCNPPQ